MSPEKEVTKMMCTNSSSAAMSKGSFFHLYINLRMSRDVFVPSFVCLFDRLLPSLQFALASFYADCPYKRI